VLFHGDEDQGYAAAFLLGTLGWPTLPHRAADTLVEVCRAFQPQVVFMDTDAAGDGPTSAPDLRAACDDQDLVVVAIAAPRPPHEPDWASRRGFDAVVRAPLRPGELVAVLHGVQRS
jgi:AmiR/NasT family two-component response regulator